MAATKIKKTKPLTSKTQKHTTPVHVIIKDISKEEINLNETLVAEKKTKVTPDLNFYYLELCTTPFFSTSSCNCC